MNFETHLSKKELIFWQGYQTAISLERKRGHLKWSLAELSRASKIERSMIYYYFGKSKVQILQNAIHFVGEILFGLYPTMPSLWMSGDFLTSIECCRDILRKHPHLGVFFLEQRQKGSIFYKEIGLLEKRYLKKLASGYPHIEADQLRVLFSNLVGIALLPEVDEATLKKLVKNFNSILKKSNNS